MKEKVEVVISGTAGVFPECKNIPQLEEALFNNVHLVTDDDRKWKQGYSFPTHCGKAFSHDHFDAIFFKVPFNLPYTMDAIAKQSLETSVEAIIDAGVNPKSLAGSRTAVYSMYDFSEMELSIAYTQMVKVLLGSARTFTANRLSFALNLHGPSYTSQGGAGAIFHLIEKARSQLEEGTIDAAIVVSGNFLLTARSLAILDGMGLAAKDGKCRPFDKKANGYALSESCVAFFLQRESDARRNWATVIGADHKFFGQKQGSILAFDGRPAKEMLRQLYCRCQVDPASVCYIEADGSGIKDRDVDEVDIISDVFCQRRKEPLLIGSIKSNMGHAECTACAVGAVKAIVALNSSKIPPTIHVESPIPELTSKGLKIVTETTPFKGNYVGINAIGLGGHFGHLLLKMNPKKSSTMEINETFPQLLLLSSRTEKGMEQVMDQAKKTNITPEFAGMVNDIFGQEVRNHMYRAYSIVPPKTTDIKFKTQRADGGQRPIWWVFSGMGSQWNGMGAQLMHVPIFRDVIDRCDKVLAPRGLDIKHIITSTDKDIFENILHAFVGITASQIGLVEVLRALELEPEGIVGHSVGELGCAYADNCLTLEQTILAAYARGRASLESTLIKGMMAAIGLGYGDILSRLPKTIDVACRNSDTSCTISGPAADVEEFVAELKAKGIFAKSVNVANIAYHSRYIQPAAPILLKYLKEVIPEKTKRSEKWISSSVPKKDWTSDLATYSSPDYHTNNLLSPVLFEDAIKSIPSNAVCIEIAPHGLLQAILKRALPTKVTNVPLTHRSSPDGVKFLLDAIGQLYLLGFEPKVSALYPAIQFPVPRDTPSLQPFTTWDHSETYGLPAHLAHVDEGTMAVSERVYSLKEVKNILNHYQENDSPVSPMSFFLIEIWKIFGGVEEKEFNKLPVVFENIQIYAEINLSIEDPSEIYFGILSSGEFIVNQVIRRGEQEIEEETTLIRGKIQVWENPKPTLSLKDEKDVVVQSLSTESLCIDGVRVQAISDLNLSSNGMLGKIRWNKDWVEYLNAIFNANLLQKMQEADAELQPSSVQFIHIHPERLEFKRAGSNIEFSIQSTLQTFESEGVSLRKMTTKLKPTEEELVEKLYFVSYGETSFVNQQDFMQACLQVIVENSARARVADGPTKINVIKPEREPIFNRVFNILEDALLTLDSEINIEMTIGDPKSSVSEAHLAVLSDPKAISQLSAMGNIENIYLLAAVPDSNFTCGKEYSAIYEQTFGSERLCLFKKMNPYSELKTFVVSNNWRASLEALKANELNRGDTVMLVMERPSSINPFFTIREILSELSYAYKAKCCLILDEYAPKFSSSNDLYGKQFEKDLAINVLENGRWGCFRKQQIPKTILSRLLPAMPVADRVSDNVDIQFIGLNETDSEGGEGEIAVLDYSGITSSGDHVMGIACKESGAGKKVILDPILQWKIPKDVPLDDAAALPFAYLMANYVIRDCFKPKVLSKVVLVYNGHTANGLAQIAVALAEGYTVHTTVPDDEAKEIIRRLFPKIPEWQMSNHNEPNYYTPLMRSTATRDRLAGAGADIVVSDLPPEKMLVAWTLVARHGCFYNLSDEVFKHNNPLPMNKFIYSTSFVSCTKANIIAMAPERKRVLKGIVDEFLRDGQVVRLPFETLSVENISSKPRIIKESLQSGGKLLLKLQNSIKNRNNQQISTKCTSCDPDGTYLVLSSTISKTAGVIKWLLTQGAKSIAIATTNRASGMNAAREIDDCIVKHGATVLMTGGAKAATIEEATALVEQASKLSRVAAVFTIGLDSNTTIVSNIKQVMKKMKLPGPLVNLHGKNSRIVPDTISIACEGNVNYDQVLSHAMTNPDEAAAYAVTERTRNKVTRISVLDQNTRRTQKLTDYLPSSLENLEEMGRLLTYNDSICDTQTLAKFVLTTTKAPFDKLYKEIRPVFVIPAFCETQIRPLISKLMYPCFVAHIKPDVPTVNQVALHLLKSMMRIQKKGPYTIVGETLSGGVATVLSRLLSDAGHEVSLFLLQGIPDKMQTLLPSQENLSEYLVDVLFNTNAKFTSSRSTRDSSNFLDSLPDTCEKSLVERAFKAIHKSLELSKSCATAVKQKGTLILMEMEYYCQLSIDDIDQMSEKSVRLVKSERISYEEMLTDPVILRTIARDTAFSWTAY